MAVQEVVAAQEGVKKVAMQATPKEAAKQEETRWVAMPKATKVALAGESEAGSNVIGESASSGRGRSRWR